MPLDAWKVFVPNILPVNIVYILLLKIVSCRNRRQLQDSLLRDCGHDVKMGLEGVFLHQRPRATTTNLAAGACTPPHAFSLTYTHINILLDRSIESLFTLST